MPNHIYHCGVKLTRECMSCMGRGQLKSVDMPQLSFNAHFDSLCGEYSYIIIMCNSCEGNGVVMNHDVWMKFKVDNNPFVVHEVEQFVTEHLKPEYA